MTITEIPWREGGGGSLSKYIPHGSSPPHIMHGRIYSDLATAEVLDLHIANLSTTHACLHTSKHQPTHLWGEQTGDT